MSYATPEDYEKYGEDLIPVSEQEKVLCRASDEIDSLTYNRIVAKKIEKLTDFQQKNVKKAVCRQADFLYQYGDYVNMPLSGFSAGSISMSLKVVEGGGEIGRAHV